MGENERELKSFLIKMKEESEKAGLKLNVQKLKNGIWSNHFMENTWGESGKGNRFHFLGLQNNCRR